MFFYCFSTSRLFGYPPPPPPSPCSSSFSLFWSTTPVFPSTGIDVWLLKKLAQRFLFVAFSSWNMCKHATKHRPFWGTWILVNPSTGNALGILFRSMNSSAQERSRAVVELGKKKPDPHSSCGFRNMPTSKVSQPWIFAKHGCTGQPCHDNLGRLVFQSLAHIDGTS